MLGSDLPWTKNAPRSFSREAPPLSPKLEEGGGEREKRRKEKETVGTLLASAGKREEEGNHQRPLFPLPPSLFSMRQSRR